ncbi:MAG: MFS transporter [Deltaproteobacteria bacterium]|nr:MFS transporter [Deltaproteobacteria bacterium]
MDRSPVGRAAEKQGRGEQPKISRAYSNYVLILLFVVYIFNFIDRQVLSILLEPIKKDLGVSDTFMGFLNGFAFVIFYTCAGIPIARIADRTSRRAVIALGLVTWSVMTAVSGLARTGWQLAAARVGVGVGEAAGTPPAHSLISDYFDPSRRATALSIYSMGVYLGVAAAFMGGSWLATHFGWRSVFMVVGLAGVPLAVLVRATVRELPRGYSEIGPVAQVEPAPFSATLLQLMRNRSFVWIVSATALQSLSGYGILTWGPTFLIRIHGMEMLDVGLTLGAAIGILGAAGAYFGGRWADAMAKRNERWYMILPAIQTAALLPFAYGFILLDSRVGALLCFVPFYFLGAMYVGPMHSVIQGLVVPNQRAVASAINLFIVNMVGLGLGPLVIGFLNDVWAAEYGVSAIRYSMLLAATVGFLSSGAFWLASRHLPEDLQAARDAARGE